MRFFHRFDANALRQVFVNAIFSITIEVVNYLVFAPGFNDRFRFSYFIILELVIAHKTRHLIFCIFVNIMR